MGELIPGGAQTLSKMRGRFPGAYPRSLVGGSGATVCDSEGFWYVDWICALGAVTLGYNDDQVDEAVREQVAAGPIFSLPNVALEERVAQRLVDLIPCAESVRFFKTGSEATEAAIRVARAATGREIILCCGYHGWHSWYAATRPERPGVPRAMASLAYSVPYNRLDLLERTYQGVAGNVAAFILEPTLVEPPAAGYLEGVRQFCTERGIVLVFDEMVTGFRWHAGGYQALCRVVPDLATFGKGMGNGYPIAALVGRADVMRHAVFASGTFSGDLIGLAAADVTLARYQQRDVCKYTRRIGQALVDSYDALAGKYGVPTRAVGQPPHPVIWWEEEPGSRSRASLFFQEVVKQGHLLHPDGLNVMLAHTELDVSSLLAACEVAMGVLARAIADGTVLERIEGEPISPEPPWRVTR